MADSSHDQPTVAAEAIDASVPIAADASAAALTNEKPSATELPSISNLIAETASDLAPIAGASTPSAPATGTATPNVQLNPEQALLSLKVSLADLSAKAARLYAQRSYEEAAELYSAAAEMQAEMNGDMSPENAEVLFLYGRALFKVGQSKSDVLGGKAPEAQKKKAAKKQKTNGAKKTNGAAQKEESASLVEAAEDKTKNGNAVEEVEKAVEEKVAAAAAEQTSEEKGEISEAKKPFFQFEGDENFDESDEDEDAEQGEGEGEEEEEEEDDLGVAFEILDLARVLFNKKLATLDDVTGDAGEDKGKGKEVAEAESNSPEAKHVKERLADTHDLLAEISLENERYPNAITDFRQSLKLKKELFPPESEIIAEAHYKLSLALEFSSITTSADEAAAKNGEKKDIDENLRQEAATELEAAINSTKLKLQNQEVELATLHNPEDNDVTRQQIAEVKDILAEMEQRLVELKKPPVNVKDALGGSLGDIFGSALGNVPGSTNAAKLDEAKKNANDLTGLVRKKRKADDEPAAEDGAEVKKTKTDEAEAATAE